MGVVVTLCMVIVYAAGNIGVFLFYRRERRSEFRLFLHALCPLVSTLALIWVGIKSVVPLPEAPVKYAPFVVLGWLLLGGMLLGAMKRAGREAWLLKAGHVAYEKQGAVPNSGG